MIFNIEPDQLESALSKAERQTKSSQYLMLKKKMFHVRKGRAEFLQKQLAPRLRWQNYIRTVTASLLRKM
jgi:hypothetical protein